MAKRKTAKKKTAKRARAAKSTTVTTMTTKTTRTTTSRNPANPFSQVASKDPKAARLLAIAFIVAHGSDDVYPVLRAFDRERGARGGALGAWLQGKYFLPYGDEVYGWEGQNFQDLQELAHAYLDRQRNPQTNPALLYSETTLVLVDEEDEEGAQRNPIKGAGKFPRFTKVDDRIYLSTASFTSESAYGQKYKAEVDFRIDGRDGPFYRVDMHTIGPWEAIDGGEQSARDHIRTLPAAKALITKWLSAAREQQTLSPRIDRAANPSPAREKNPRLASLSRRISGV